MPALPLTLAVITRNEAATIARCLDSVPFAAEKLVVDSGSDDDTVVIAQAHGARVIHQDWLGFGPQRNFASSQCAHDWILVLDADEYIGPELAAELQQRLPALMASDAPAAWLYHRDRARWSDARVHESLHFDGVAPTLRATFLHTNSPPLVHKQLKVLRYTELKCRDWLDRRKPVRMWQAPFVFMLAFLKDYVFRLAFLDGWRGFMIAHTAASYAIYKRMRYYEMVHNPDSVARAGGLLLKHEIDR